MALNKSSMCVLLLLVVATTSLQHSGNEITKEQWNPLDIFRTDAQPDDASTDAKAPLHEELSAAKSAVKSASKHAHKSKGKLQRWELEEDSFEKPREFCEESCTSSNLRVTTWESKCETTNCQGCDPCKEIQRNSASKHALDISPMGDRVPPRMLVAPGCDGSSAVLKHAHAIMEMHGIRSPGKGGHLDEVIKGEDASNRTMAQVQQHLEWKNQTLLFRGVIGTDQETIFSKNVSDIGTLTVQVSRRNLLDQAACMVKDCVGPHMGHPVLRGEESDLCIKRRQAKDSWMKGQYKAFLDVSTLIANIKILEDDLNQTATDLHNLGYSPASLKTEDLLDFEWSENMMWRAVPAWTSLLESWGIELDKHALVAYLKENAGTRDPPVSQEASIFNFRSVKEEIMNHTKYDWMIRE